MTFSETPTVPQVSTPSVAVMVTRVMASVPWDSSSRRHLVVDELHGLPPCGYDATVAMRRAASRAPTGPALSPVATKRPSPTWIFTVASDRASLARAPVSSRSSTMTRKLSNVNAGAYSLRWRMSRRPSEPSATS